MAGANTYDFLGEGTNQPVAPAVDPDDQPNPSNPGGLSNNQIRQSAHARDSVSAQAQQTANVNAPGLQQRATPMSEALLHEDDPFHPHRGISGGFATPAYEAAHAARMDTHQRGIMGNLARDPLTLSVLLAPYAVTGAGAVAAPVGALGFGEGAGTIAAGAGETAAQSAAASAAAASTAAETAGVTTGAAAPTAAAGTAAAALPAVAAPTAAAAGTTLLDKILAGSSVAASGGKLLYDALKKDKPAPDPLLRGGFQDSSGMGVNQLGTGGAPLSDPASTAAGQANAMGDLLMAGASGAAGRTDAASADVRAFLDEERNRKGSSEAEALLNKTADRIQSQALGLAAGARGGAGARERATNQAISGNAYVGAQATQDLAVLRAKEDQDKRDRLLTIMNLLSANAGRGDVLQQGQQGQAVDMYGRAIGATQSAENNASTAAINAANNASNERSTVYSANAGSDNITRHDAFVHNERKDQEPGYGEEVFEYTQKALEAAKKNRDLF